jgi:NADH-quinone oxidoreductase subunit H
MTEFLQGQLGSSLPSWAISLIASLIAIVAILLTAVGTMMMMVWLERRVVARMQDRIGPNRVGPAGLLQSIADGVKMFTKEDIVPRAADQWVHLLAPMIVVAPTMLMFAVFPWGRGLVPIPFETGVLFVLAISSISAIGLMMAGWSSSNKFALLGAMRAVAQLISYEIPGVLAILSAVVVAGSMDLSQMIELQSGIPLLGKTVGVDLGLGWLVFTPVGLLGFGIFFICSLAEGERTPFDIPEADSEIVAGHTTEYSGMKFALFYIGQYVLNFALAILAAIVFLGGWQGPLVAQLASGSLAPLATLLSLFYLLLKAWALFFVMIWLRGALPRLRIDQLLDLAWKFLVPLALFNLLSAALWVALTQWDATQGFAIAAGFSPVIRQMIALIVTGLISGGALVWLLSINRTAAGDPDADAALDFQPSPGMEA